MRSLQGIEVLDLLEGQDIGLGGENRLGRDLLADLVINVEVTLIGAPAVDDGLLGIDPFVELVPGEEVLDIEGTDTDRRHKDPPLAVRTFLWLRSHWGNFRLGGANRQGRSESRIRAEGSR
ncbi:MAG: hypothetical protein C3F12_04500 [Candidatus Methylomirabilota bacterium]|nr:hypothetical protein [candidate division NC10 bacterium]PWB47242.1 MAG: hypothetical protein C3F12_04500 [candidate division NC10 bacterium]